MENGQKNEGISVHYTMVGEPENTPDSKGSEPVKGSLPLSADFELKAVPGYYMMEFSMGTVKNAQGRASNSLKPKAIQFVAACHAFRDLPDTGKMPLPAGVGVSTSPANPGGRVGA